MANVSMMTYPVRDGFQPYQQHYNVYPTRPQSAQMAVGQPVPFNSYSHSTTTLQQPQPQQQQQSHQHHQEQQPQPSQPQSQPQHTTYYQPQTRSPQPSGSPVSDDGNKPSLPSISNLLSFADRPSTDNSASSHTEVSTSRDQNVPQQSSPQVPQHVDTTSNLNLAATYAGNDDIASPRTMVPAPPPMRNESVLEPTIVASAPTLPGNAYYVASAINNVDPTDQRSVQIQTLKRRSVPSQPNLSPYGDARYTPSPYAASPGALSAPAYYSPPNPSYPGNSHIYQQRPLPSNFPPPAPSIALQPATALPTSNPWEHHHYISPSSQATFPQSQDRYICPTCNKAFSRPSSLKIHSHSHTGEKPFRCPHAGCGKAFSVRSNMKRHERGCHSGIAGHISHPHLI